MEQNNDSTCDIENPLNFFRNECKHLFYLVLLIFLVINNEKNSKKSQIIASTTTFKPSNTSRSIPTSNFNGKQNTDFLKKTNTMSVVNNINSILTSVGKKVIFFYIF